MLYKYPGSYSLLTANYAYVCFEVKNKTAHHLIFLHDQKEQKIAVSEEIRYPAVDKDGLLYYSEAKTNEIKSISINGQTRDLGVKGYVITIMDNDLYFSREHDTNIQSANADIFVVNTKSPGKPQKLVTNTAGEATVIYPGGKYIYDEVLTGGEFKPIIYSVENKKYVIINVEKRFLNAPQYYSYQKKCLIFYDIKTFETKTVELPKVFDIAR